MWQILAVSGKNNKLFFHLQSELVVILGLTKPQDPKSHFCYCISGNFEPCCDFRWNFYSLQVHTEYKAFWAIEKTTTLWILPLHEWWVLLSLSKLLLACFFRSFTVDFYFLNIWAAFSMFKCTIIIETKQGMCRIINY